MAIAIRKFQEERQELESQLDKLQKSYQQEGLLRGEAERQVGQMSAELEQLRAQQASNRGNPADAQAAEQVRRAHHEKQLAFMGTIDSLRRELQQEQTKSRALEKRAAQAELRSRQASAEDELDCTRAALRRAASGATEASGGDSLGTPSRNADPMRDEVRALEDEALMLREELNASKQKVVELKKAALQRGADWKEQLKQITEDAGATQRLEDENAQLRLEHARLRRDLGQLQGQEEGSRKEAEQLRREAAKARAAGKDAQTEADGRMEEMKELSTKVGDQLVAVEQELRQQVQKSNQLFELFLRHSLQPLDTIRRCCRQLASELGPAPEDRELAVRPAPPVIEADVQDLKNQLVKLVNLLRYCADVLDAQDLQRHSQSVTSGGALEETRGFAQSWFQGVLT